jgi:putative tryptophan/tyrosine transport system substrate-binding protein
MRRRKFISLLGAAATMPVFRPFVARAQQMMSIGFVYAQTADGIADRLRGFRHGLKELGFVEGENLAIVYRFAEGRIDRLPELIADLPPRVAVIAALGNPAALAAKAAAGTTPMVFAVNANPVELGLVASLSRPGGHATGVNFFTAELAAKRLELLHELVPAATRVAVLINPINAKNAEATLQEIEPAARSLGLQIEVIRVGNGRELDVAFAAFERDHPDAIFTASDGLFTSRRTQLVNLASRYALPATFHSREIAEVGGLMSYGTDIADAFRQAGVYAGRILKGEKPGDLPVVQASKFEFVINAQTARMLGLTIPASLLSLADEVIE